MEVSLQQRSGMKPAEMKPRSFSETKPRAAELEEYFTHFSDMPREVIVKEDVLRLGVRFSQAALDLTPGCRVKSYRLFSYDSVKIDDMKRQEASSVPEDMKLFGGPYGLRRTFFATRYFPDSPYLIDVVDGQLVLKDELSGQIIANVAYPPAPKYYSYAFEDGTLYRDVVPIVWDHVAFITAFRYCQYWGPKEECQFCDINSNARQLKKAGKRALSAPFKQVDQVAKVMESIYKEQTAPDCRLTNIMISGGAILKVLDGKTEDEFYWEYLRAVRKVVPQRVTCVIQTGPKPKEIMKQYRDLGMDAHNANMEVWDRRLFHTINPGKSRVVGWENWVRLTCDAVDVLGEGSVNPNFVCGVEMCKPYGFETVKEAVQSTSEGLEYYMSRGVVPRFVSWAREWGSYLKDQPPVPLEFYVRIMRAHYETWRKYGLPSVRGYGPMGSGYAIDANSSFMDMEG